MNEKEIIIKGIKAFKLIFGSLTLAIIIEYITQTKWIGTLTKILTIMTYAYLTLIHKKMQKKEKEMEVENDNRRRTTSKRRNGTIPKKTEQKTNKKRNRKQNKQ